MPVAEFFLEHVDHKEEKAVSAAYQFYKMSKAESFSIESFRGIWEKNEGIGQEDAGPAGHAGEACYGDDGYPEFMRNQACIPTVQRMKSRNFPLLI